MAKRPTSARLGPNDTATPIEAKIIRIRAFIAPTAKRKKKRRRTKFPASPWTLIFDTETRVDPGQALRFGIYQLRYGELLVEHGLFYEADSLDAAETLLLERMARQLPITPDGESVRLRMRQSFVDDVLLRMYRANGRIVGFNLPFDLSRLALRHGPARKGMAGGFSFVLSRQPGTPRLRIKSLSQRAAFIQFGYWNGFVDVKTLAGALLGGNYSLETLSKTLGVMHAKSTRDDHGERLTEDYVRYAVNDVQATWECYAALKARLDSYQLPDADVSALYSEASFGKTCLRAMNVKPWLACQDDFPDEMAGIIASAYFGGRAEVHIRRTPTRVVLCDFLSMYPTVLTLMGLWRFVIAKGVDWRDATDEARALVSATNAEALRGPDAWKALAVLVQVAPDDDIFPVRTGYGHDDAISIGLNYLSSERPLWFTLADVLVSNILTGRAPHIVRAIRFTPRNVQDDLSAINICGNADFRVDPARDDFYKRIIELRQLAKVAAAQAPPEKKAVLEAQQQALKITANSTGYGIFMELNVKDQSKEASFACHFGQASASATNQYEEPGEFFHPLLGALITGGARLMLALAEKSAVDHGLDWAFCDTDSLALAKPNEMDEAEFQQRVRAVTASFSSLNPYNGNDGASILQIERLNFKENKPSELDEIMCVAISAKRYALYKLDGDKSIIRKGSQHGLGHHYPPYEDPERANRLKRIRIEKWQEEYWTAIINALHSADPNAPPDLRAFHAPAISRYSATRPEMLRWFDAYNASRPYAEQVKPFNFLFSLQVKSELSHLSETHGDDARSGGLPRPAAPFDRNIEKAASLAFDRRTGEPIHKSALRSLGESLRHYDVHPEAKFHGGGVLERGVLRRRRIRAIAIQPIGKETEALEVAEFIGEETPGVTHTLAAEDRDALLRHLRTSKHSARKLCARAGIHHSTFRDAIAEKSSDATLMQIADAASALDLEQNEAIQLRIQAHLLADEIGIAALAKGLDIDQSNLGKALSGKRRMPNALIRRLRECSRLTRNRS